MKKYLYIYKYEVMTNIQYVFNLIGDFIGFFLVIFVFLNLWKYIYSDPSELINGYGYTQMVWYIILTELLWSVLGGRKFCKKIINDVKGGNIVYNINKPYSYISYYLFSHLGECTTKAVIYSLLSLVTGYLMLGCFPTLSIGSILSVLLTGVLSIVISSLLIILIGLLSFFIEDSNPIYWIYSKYVLLLGVLFPIEFFPDSMKMIMRFSPIYVISYGPARLFVNFELSEFISVLVTQIIYVFAIYIICLLLYKKGVKNLNVNGG